MNKLQRKVKAARASAKRRVATALETYLKRANPGKTIMGAKVQKLKGGVIKITPVRANAGAKRLHVATESKAAQLVDHLQQVGFTARYFRDSRGGFVVEKGRSRLGARKRRRTR